MIDPDDVRPVAPVITPPLEIFSLFEEIESESRAEPIVIVSNIVLSLPIFIALPPAPVPMFIVFPVLPLPRLTVPEVPESRVTDPIDPEVTEIFPVVAVSNVIPFVPELRARPVAPVALPTVIVFAFVSVPIFIAPVPVFKLNVPFVVV